MTEYEKTASAGSSGSGCIRQVEIDGKRFTVLMCGVFSSGKTRPAQFFSGLSGETDAAVNQEGE